MTITEVSIPERPRAAYRVCIGDAILPAIIPELQRDWPGLRLFAVTDASLRDHGHLAALVGDHGIDSFVIDPPGEVSKTLRTVEAILTALETRRYGRDSLLIALGGGMVGDIVGFAAALFKRGVPCVQAPTTTVAQADSALGGKVGVDSGLSKNAYGAFHHPARVYMDCGTLRTLDERHFRAGLAESVKHAMIADAAFFGYLEANLNRILAREAAVLEELGARNCRIKGAVVFQDPEEAGLRRILNFGHTIGHAVESASGYRLLHGESVAIGIVGACLLGESLGLTPPGIRQRAAALFGRLGLPVAIPKGIPESVLLDAMARDKKAKGQTPRFVVLEALGRVCPAGGHYVVEVRPEMLHTVLTVLAGDGGLAIENGELSI